MKTVLKYPYLSGFLFLMLALFGVVFVYAFKAALIIVAFIILAIAVAFTAAYALKFFYGVQRHRT